MEIFFIKAIRKERVFSSPKELADQIKKDEMIARETLGLKI
jgi:FAD synthase